MSPELVNGLFALAGALVGALATGVIAWRQAKALGLRRELTATTTSSSKLLEIDRTVKADVEVRIRGRLVPSIYMCSAVLENTGNQVVESIEATVEVTDECEIINVEIGDLPAGAEATALQAAILSPHSARLQIPFLNPGETVSARLLLSANPKKVSVKCRQLGPNVLNRDGYDPTQPGAAVRVLYESIRQNPVVHWYFRISVPAYRRYWESEERRKLFKRK
jgi:hypothetical protein